MHLDIYETIKDIKINEYKEISLVENQVNHCLYIKRVLKYYNYDIYKRIQKLDNKYIPKIYELEEIENKLYIIEEYINSNTLDYYIENDKLTNEQIIDIMNQLCDCLDKLHHCHPPIIHRDIKPENIFYNGQDIKLFDFDIARHYTSKKEKDTVVMGSVGYAAPEQFGFGQSSNRVDIYALGVLLNMMLYHELSTSSGIRPYSNIINKATSIDERQRYDNVLQMKLAINKSGKLSFIYKIPGFRTNKRSHQVIAIIGYLFWIAISITIEQDTTAPENQWIVKVLYSLIVIGTILYWSNFCNILNKVSFSKKRLVNYFIRYVVYMIFIIIITQLLLLI